MTAAAALQALHDDDARIGEVAEVLHAALTGKSVDHLRAAVMELRSAEHSEGCAWCRSHITDLRILGEDLVRVAELGEDAGRGELGAFARRTGDLAERLGALGVLGRIVHRVKGLGR